MKQIFLFSFYTIFFFWQKVKPFARILFAEIWHLAKSGG